MTALHDLSVLAIRRTMQINSRPMKIMANRKLLYILRSKMGYGQIQGPLGNRPAYNEKLLHAGPSCVYLISTSGTAV